MLASSSGFQEACMLRLSVLDQSTVVTGRSPDTSIRESIRLAQHCEALGYSRYWCAEHHNSDSQAGTAPEILISAIAATTSRIRVGSAGIMLPHYSIAESGRAVPRAGCGRARADRPGPGPRAGLRRAHGVSRSTHRRRPRLNISRPRCATCWPGSMDYEAYNANGFQRPRGYGPVNWLPGLQFLSPRRVDVSTRQSKLPDDLCDWIRCESSQPRTYCDGYAAGPRMGDRLWLLRVFDDAERELGGSGSPRRARRVTAPSRMAESTRSTSAGSMPMSCAKATKLSSTPDPLRSSQAAGVTRRRASGLSIGRDLVRRGRHRRRCRGGLHLHVSVVPSATSALTASDFIL